jgi:hypothetical protein
LIGTVKEYVYASTREVEILVKLVNTETSTLLVTTDVFDRAPSRESLRQKMRELAAKLRWKDPRVPRQVTKVLDDRVKEVQSEGSYSVVKDKVLGRIRRHLDQGDSLKVITK